MEAPKRNVWDKVSQWQTELETLKDILATTELTETVKWGTPVYTLNGKNVLGIGGFKSYFGIWFFNGVFLSDPKNKLVSGNEGVTKSLRQWRMHAKSDINEQLILAYVKEAIANEKAGKSIKPEARSKDFQVPQMLQSALQDANLEREFAAFTPFKQREFAEYIGEAKQEKTQRARVDKILVMIAQGIGLHDKYRK